MLTVPIWSKEKEALPSGGLMKNSPNIVQLIFIFCLSGCSEKKAEIPPFQKSPIPQRTSTLQPLPISSPELQAEPAPISTPEVLPEKLDGVTNPASNPISAKKPAHPIVAAGQEHTLLIKPNGTLWACGNNKYGQLGDNSRQSNDKLKRIGLDLDWQKIAVGDVHSLGIREDGSLWAWGQNLSGQLGNGGNRDALAPTRVGTGTNWVSIAAGMNNSLALHRNGSLWAWGAILGRTGGSALRHLRPVQLGSDTNWKSIACG